MHPNILKWTLPLVLAVAPLQAEKLLVIGDSLSKEYEIEFVGLYPDNPATWEERNWLELLAAHRSDQIDPGSYGVWPDSRIAGHRFNWAFPGSQTSEWEDIMSATLISDPQKYFLRVTFDSHLEEEVDRVVIFLGGNDLKNNYSTYYSGADPESFINSLISNVRGILSYVVDRNSQLEIVLVNMPDVGITPAVQAERPDPDSRQLVTDLTNQVNEGLKDLADEFDVGYADIFSLTQTLSGPERFVIGGVQFIKSADPETASNEPTYLFSPDGFHPNTNAQLLFANEILNAFNQHYPQTPSVPLFSSEEMLSILELDPDVSFSEWANAYGLETTDPANDDDGDGADLWSEFVFGQDPRISDWRAGVTSDWTPQRVEYNYRTRVTQSAHFNLTPETSTDLQAWEPLMEDQIERSAGTLSAWFTPTPGEAFLRLHVSEPPSAN